MFADSRHTSLVKGARVVLPVVALFLLSTLFLFARTVNPDDAIPFAEVDVSERARDQQLTQPRFAGVSTDGTEYELIADRALPDSEDPRKMTADAVELTMIDTGGAQTDVRADLADIDTARRSLVLTGSVAVETSSGYVLTAPRMTGALDVLTMRAMGGVEGNGPLGRMTADEMTLTEDRAGVQRMVFTGGVDLLYLPPAD